MFSIIVRFSSHLLRHEMGHRRVSFFRGGESALRALFCGFATKRVRKQAESHLGARSRGTRRSSFPQGNVSLVTKLGHLFFLNNSAPLWRESLILRQIKTNFCLPDKSSFFSCFLAFLRQNHAKSRRIT